MTFSHEFPDDRAEYSVETAVITVQELTLIAAFWGHMQRTAERRQANDVTEGIAVNALLGLS